MRSLAYGSIEPAPFLEKSALDNAKVVFEHARGTIYVHGAIVSLAGYQAFEGSEIVLKEIKHAQFKRAILVSLVPRGKRRRREFVETTSPSTVVVDGWGHPALPAPLKPDGQARYAAFEDGWNKEFSEWLETSTRESGIRVVADLREHNSGEVRSASERISPSAMAPTVTKLTVPIVEGRATT